VEYIVICTFLSQKLQEQVVISVLPLTNPHNPLTGRSVAEGIFPLAPGPGHHGSDRFLYPLRTGSGEDVGSDFNGLRAFGIVPEGAFIGWNNHRSI